MQQVTGDGDAHGEVFARAREIAAAFVATPVEEQLLHRYAAPELRPLVSKRGHQHIIGLHGARDAYAHGFLAKRRREGAEAARSLESHGLLVEAARCQHCLVQPHDRIAILRKRR